MQKKKMPESSASASRNTNERHRVSFHNELNKQRQEHLFFCSRDRGEAGREQIVDALATLEGKGGKR